MRMSMVVAACAGLGLAAMGCVSNDGGASGDADSELTLEVGPGAHVLTLSTETAPQNVVDVTTNDGEPPRDCVGTDCQLAFLSGVGLTLRIPFPTDNPNCVAFNHWTGACAGQGNPCTITLDTDKTTEAVWTRLRGCVPR